MSLANDADNVKINPHVNTPVNGHFLRETHRQTDTHRTDRSTGPLNTIRYEMLF